MTRIAKYTFKARPFTALLTLVVLVILLRLGFWQLDRAEEKRQILARQQAQMQLPAIDISRLPEDITEMEFRRVQIQGVFDSSRQVFIDNKVHNGRPGYHVVTPLKISGRAEYVLVDRGWVPMNPDRRILPTIDTPASVVSVYGLVKTHPRDVADLGSDNRSNQGWPAVVRWVDIDWFSRETNLQTLPILMLLDKAAKHGFVREWKFVNLPPEKSTSYAVTWFSLAAVLVIIFFSVNLKCNPHAGPDDE